MPEKKRARSSLQAMADFAFERSCDQARLNLALERAGKPVSPGNRYIQQVTEDICHFIDAMRTLDPELKAKVVDHINKAKRRKSDVRNIRS